MVSPSNGGKGSSDGVVVTVKGEPLSAELQGYLAFLARQSPFQFCVSATRFNLFYQMRLRWPKRSESDALADALQHSIMDALKPYLENCLRETSIRLSVNIEPHPTCVMVLPNCSIFAVSMNAEGGRIHIIQSDATQTDFQNSMPKLNYGLVAFCQTEGKIQDHQRGENPLTERKTDQEYRELKEFEEALEDKEVSERLHKGEDDAKKVEYRKDQERLSRIVLAEETINRGAPFVSTPEVLAIGLATGGHFLHTTNQLKNIPTDPSNPTGPEASKDPKPVAKPPVRPVGPHDFPEPQPE